MFFNAVVVLSLVCIIILSLFIHTLVAIDIRFDSRFERAGALKNKTFM